MTDTQHILSHLLEGKTLTNAEAYQLFGITRLSGRILDLRKAGYSVKTVMESNTTKPGQHAVYSL